MVDSLLQKCIVYCEHEQRGLRENIEAAEPEPSSPQGHQWLLNTRPFGQQGLWKCFQCTADNETTAVLVEISSLYL